jgi:hypothetical protein
MAYADLKCEKGSISVGYQRLFHKHKTFTEKAEQEKAELLESHTTELAKLRGDLDLETHSYTEYCLNVRHWLRELHNTISSTFDEVEAQCLPFSDRGMKIEEMLDWVAGEVTTVPDTVWQLNNNFTVLAVKGVLSMLNSKGYQELGRLGELATSSDASVLQHVPNDV